MLWEKPSQYIHTYIHIYVTKGHIYRKFPMGGFSTWLHYLFVKIFVYCTDCKWSGKLRKIYIYTWNRLLRVRCKIASIAVRKYWIFLGCTKVACCWTRSYKLQRIFHYCSILIYHWQAPSRQHLIISSALKADGSLLLLHFAAYRVSDMCSCTAIAHIPG
jgi:hypothetical protein